VPGFEAEYLSETPESELISHEAELDGYRIVLTQEFLPSCRGGHYFYAVFDSAGHLRAVSTRDGVFLPMASSAEAPEPDGRATPQLAAALLGIIAPKLKENDARVTAAV
jgi:hypothetical protein